MKPIIIGIAGGTGSGKSTFTNKIKDAFPNDTSIIYYDNYYKSQDDIPFEQRKLQNYDHPSAFETELLLEHLECLKRGESVQCPVYDYTQHTRSKEVVEINPSPVIILEGILVLQDERLRNQMDIKVYVDADADERILRRAVRDVEERGRDLQGIVDQYLTTVKPMHYIYVEPTRALADVVLNSGMNDVAFDVVSAKIRSILNGV
ncbi:MULTISPECIES: uridine kinase [Agathobacter]|uniref:Uridine kinase n=1 Tax=Agathobacter ruminis TaxID=1712665 RepID=A0A2G3E2T1_9FIRM|nr:MULTISPECIES: uridine kinase [Agathobacter]MBQ1681834.1 uridine kinase [Agathobacter sp.]MCR5676635.1 uridine kinase [Agathobacter sp.]MDC7300897.1 uridine kinase [Agathobacter ruminis]PHU37460.1 uridine kinase [Agathobacter ruminis]